MKENLHISNQELDLIYSAAHIFDCRCTIIPVEDFRIVEVKKIDVDRLIKSAFKNNVTN